MAKGRKLNKWIVAGIVLAVVFVGFFFLTLSGVVLWEIGVFSTVDGGKGYTGFNQMKPLDHAYTNQGLDIVFTNAFGARVKNLTVSVDGVDFSDDLDSKSVKPGDAVSLVAVPDVCGKGVRSYNVAVDISYVNSITGLKRVESGRVWGPC